MEQYLKNKCFPENDIVKAWELIQTSKSITLLTHWKPDADGIAACTTLSYLLGKQNKNIETIYPTNPECTLNHTPDNVLINQHKQTPDLIIICDTSNYKRAYYPEEFKTIPTINIDHHISNNIQATINFVEPQASSTCETLYSLLKKWDKNLIDEYVANCLLLGILYDTGVFHTQSARPQTLRISADLMEAGANLYKLKTELLANKNPQIITLWGNLLKNTQFSPNKNAAWIVITQEELNKLNLTISSIVGFSNFLSGLSNVDVTLVFYETEDGQTKVSLRSKQADVNELAKKFDGGGHKNASGILSDEPINKVVQEITKLL